MELPRFCRFGGQTALIFVAGYVARDTTDEMLSIPVLMAVAFALFMANVAWETATEEGQAERRL